MGSIYKIENIVNGKCYFGQTVGNPHKRRRDHFCALKMGKHRNKHLQFSWNKHGEGSFTFTVISDSVENNQLDEIEKKLISIFKTNTENFGYNKTSGGNVKKTASETAKENHRKAQIKYWTSNPSAVEKRRAHMLEFYANGGEHHMLGKKHTEEVRKHMSNLYKGKKKPPELVEKCRLGHIGRKNTPETIEKMRVAQKMVAMSPNYVNPRKGAKNSPEHIKKMVETKRRKREEKA
jgi:group I intron endonuclease